MSCLGGSFKGVGVHEFRLSAEQETEGLKVCEAKYLDTTDAKRNLTCVVLLLLRGFLLRCHYSHQIEHFFYASAHCIGKKEVYTKSVCSLCHVYTHEPHRVVIHHLPLQPCPVSTVDIGLVVFWLTMPPKIRMGHFYPGR